MNKQRRERLEAVTEKLNEILGEEQEAFDNMPESLQYSERGEVFEENIAAMEGAIEEINAILER